MDFALRDTAAIRLWGRAQRRGNDKGFAAKIHLSELGAIVVAFPRVLCAASVGDADGAEHRNFARGGRRAIVRLHLDAIRTLC